MIQKGNDIFVEREIYPQILKWLNEKEMIIIQGSRQTGKTTLLLKLKEQLKDQKAIYVNFEDTNQLESFLRSPKDFVSLQLASSDKTYFLFDEFHYVPNAGKILKLLYDEYRQAKFIVTGSSSLAIREIASYLVGRVIFFTLYPFSFAEYLSYKETTLFNTWRIFNQLFMDYLHLKKVEFPKFIFRPQFQSVLREYLTFGSYPAVAISSAALKKERLLSLIETYIEKDIIRHLKVGNFLEFKKLVKILSLQIGALVNYSSLSSDAHLSFAEIKKFVGILENTFVVKFIHPFFSNKITEIKKSPKVYFLDLGFRNSLISDFREISFRQDKGSLVENFVFQNLFIRKETSSLSFWRTKQGAEVDFILRWGNEIIPIEVKYQEYQEARLTRSLSNFLKSYKPKRALVLTKNYVGHLKHHQSEILFLPLYFV